MRLLVIHNTYRESGGEDIVVDQELDLLRRRGHDVLPVIFNNSAIRSALDRAAVTLRVGMNSASAERLATVVSAFRPDIAHVHNFFPLVSPGALEVVVRSGVPIVQTLHNFRVVCPGALLLREGRPCEDCVGASRWPAVRAKCYRGSAVGSAAVAYMGRAFRSVVDRHPHLITLVALTQFARSRFLADGFAERQVIVRPNFAPDIGPGFGTRDGRLLYVGRLSAEKGVDTIVKAAADIKAVIEIVGDGPESTRLRSVAPKNVIFSGRVSREQVATKLRSASAILAPSCCYEGFPMIVAEAMACGTPIIASDIGSLAEVVEDRKTGRLAPMDDVAAWATIVNDAIDAPAKLKQWGQYARRTYDKLYDEDNGYSSLMKVYDHALKTKRKLDDSR